MEIVNLQQVTKRYDGHVSVDNLNLTVNTGEIFGLLGPNGAGKSTTIKMISGLLKANNGDIFVDGIRVDKHPVEVKKRIGVVPQDLAIYDTLSAAENVAFFARLYGLRGNLLKERTDEALEFVGLSDKRKDWPETFSGGMKRRLNIACAITHHPKLLIMDEPTVGIDPQSRNHILESVKKLNRMGSTIIYTSHYMEEVEAISTRVGIMDKGHLIVSGTKQELLEQVAHEERLMIKTESLNQEAVDEIRRHPQISSVVIAENEPATMEIFLRSSQSYLQDILFILSKYDIVIQTINRVEPDLETLFLSLTGRNLRD